MSNRTDELKVIWLQKCKEQSDAWGNLQRALFEENWILPRLRVGAELKKVMVYQGWEDDDRYEYFLDGAEIEESSFEDFGIVWEEKGQDARYNRVYIARLKPEYQCEPE